MLSEKLSTFHEKVKEQKLKKKKNQWIACPICTCKGEEMNGDIFICNVLYEKANMSLNVNC